MERSRNDVWVGLFVLVGAAALLFLALQSANLLAWSFGSTYKVNGRFDNIGGLKPKAAVKSAGVVVGRVERIAFDDKTFQARVEMQQSYQQIAVAHGRSSPDAARMAVSRALVRLAEEMDRAS